MIVSNTLEVLDVKEGVLLKLWRKFLRKYIVPVTKRMGADLLECAVPEVADVVSGKKNFKTAAKSLRRQTLRKQLGGGRQKRSIPVKTLKRSSRSRRDKFTNIAN